MEVVELTKQIRDLLAMLTPSKLINTLCMYSYWLCRFLNKALGVATYIEAQNNIFDKIAADIDAAVPDSEGNYIDR